MTVVSWPEDALRAHLLADPMIATLVGDRIEPAPLTEGSKLPAITFQDVSTVRQARHFEGVGSLAQARIQLDIWTKTRIEARNLFELVRIRVDGKSGNVAGFEVQLFQIELGPRDFYEADVKLRRVSTDVMVFHTEAA